MVHCKNFCDIFHAWAMLLSKINQTKAYPSGNCLQNILRKNEKLKITGGSLSYSYNCEKW